MTDKKYFQGLEGLIQYMGRDKPLDTPQNNLYEAARTGNISLVTDSLDCTEVDIDFLHDDHTVLYTATEYNHKEVVDILIKRGADVSCCNPLIIVNDVGIAKSLVAAGADINHVDLYGDTPLHRAVLRGNLALVKYYIENGGEVNVSNGQGLSPLHLACRCSSDEQMFDIVQLLVTSGANINAKDNFGKYPLHHACDNRYMNRVIELLVQNGAKQNERDFSGQCPIHYLTRQFKLLYFEGTEKYLRGMDALLKIKGNENVFESNGCTALHIAAFEGSDNLIKHLLSHGCKHDIKDGYGRTPLHYAAMNVECTEVGKALVDAGGCVDSKDKWGQSPLYTAVEQGNLAMVQLLVENGASTDTVDLTGRTLLHACAGNKDTKIINFLLNVGLDINVIDQYSSSSLHLAAYIDNVTIADILLQKGAAIDRQDDNGHTPLQTAYCKRSENVLTSIVEHQSRLLTSTENINQVVKIEKFSTYADEMLDVSTLDNILKDRHAITRSEASLEKYLLKILQTQSIGHVVDDGEAYEIQGAVDILIKQLAANVSRVDPRFTCTLLHAGSSSEGTKVRFPDEFDFMLCLEEFSMHAYPKYPKKSRSNAVEMGTSLGDTAGQTLGERLQNQTLSETVASISDYALLYLYDRKESDRFKDFSDNTTGLLPCHVMYYSFSQLLSKVVFAEDFPTDPRLIVKEVTLEPSLKMCWRGSKYKELEIDVDVVPAIRLQKWPEKTQISKVLITPEIHSLCSVVVPKKTSHGDEELWRCSMSLQETAIFRKLHSRIRNSYVVSKALLHTSTCPFVSFEDYSEERMAYEMQHSISSDESFQLYEHPEYLVPSYIIKMVFLEALEEKAGHEGINSVFNENIETKTGGSKKEETGNQTLNSGSRKVDEFYGPAKLMNLATSSGEVDTDLVVEIFTRLKDGLEKSFVPSFFNPEHNVLGQRLLEGDASKVLLYVQYILQLLS